MNRLKVSTDVDIVVKSQVTKRCPFKDEADNGEVTITWYTDEGHSVELHELRAYLDSFAGRALSHEDFTGEVLSTMQEVLGDVDVTSRWETAGMTVTVRSTGKPPANTE